MKVQVLCKASVSTGFQVQVLVLMSTRDLYFRIRVQVSLIPSANLGTWFLNFLSPSKLSKLRVKQLTLHLTLFQFFFHFNMELTLLYFFP